MKKLTIILLISLSFGMKAQQADINCYSDTLVDQIIQPYQDALTVSNDSIVKLNQLIADKDLVIDELFKLYKIANDTMNTILDNNYFHVVTVIENDKLYQRIVCDSLNQTVINSINATRGIVKTEINYKE